MICFNCGLKLNNANDSECRFCGVKFHVNCLSCGFPNPQAARFCFNCGGRLTGAEDKSSIENYSTLSEGRKKVAVIFADVSGFTALSEKLDPEEVREIINECFNYITSPVYELEGTIDKYIGDCVMILFGARYVHADDAKRAVMCSVKMMELISDFSKSHLASRGLTLGLSIGVNYGLVVTGGVGNYFDRYYTVMGDIVNTAQRLQYSADEGMILVSESVHTETREMFDYSSPREIVAKNKEKPVKCYSPLRVRNEYFFEKDMSFIERQKEISQLNSIYNKAFNDGLRYVVITGEAGIGKTRLMREFTSQLGEDVKKVWAECNTFSMNKPYSLISGILTGIMNINPLDSKSMRQHRLLSFLDYILDKFSDEEIRRNYNFIGLLMGLDRDAEFQAIFGSMGHDSVRREILKQLALFFTSLCSKQKLLLVADDIQFADNASIELLDELIPLLSGIKAVFIFTSRYGLNSLQSGKPGQRLNIRLEKLSEDGVRKLSCSLLSCDSLDRLLFERIAGFAKGNPLYIRELTTSMDRKGSVNLENGLAKLKDRELEQMPENIQNLIMSNISTINDTCLKLLQAASVIGREFSAAMLVQLMDNTIGVEDIAGLPVQMNLIELKATHTSASSVDRTFQFTHEIEREVIYDSLLNRQKAQLHRKIGEYTELKFAGDLENHYESLCVHFSKAGNNRKAAQYYFKSAVKHRDIFNLGLAMEYFNSYLKISADDTDTGFRERISGAYFGIGQINYINANYEAALTCLEKALENSGIGDEANSTRLLTAEVYKDMGRLDDSIAILDDIFLRIKEGIPIDATLMVELGLDRNIVE
ncbi:MAG: AAA family ATPase [Clostridiales bacterium]|nr:AAA family ATPase [Clostridiales bacterium]